MALAIAMVPNIRKLNHYKSGGFCSDFKWFLTKWPSFVRISNGWDSEFQIHLKSEPFSDQPLFDHLKSGLDPH